LFGLSTNSTDKHIPEERLSLRPFLLQVPEAEAEQLPETGIAEDEETSDGGDMIDLAEPLTEATLIAPGPRRNAMKGQTAAVDIVLHEWGRWMRNADDVLGWSKVNILGKVKIDGLDGAAQASAPTEIPDGIMEVDAAIAKLRDIRQQVIKIAYLKYPNAPMDVQRRKVKMSRHRWSYVLKECRAFIAAHLGIAPE
jgi:hypothetical protein